MGVQGLWSVLHCTGRDIDLSSLEGKILAIDMSIWLNQALKSGIDSPFVHLEILFRRICKLLFYKIKPVFVFDGPAPQLKTETIIARRRQRQLKQDKSEQIRSNIIKLLMKKSLTQKRKHQEENIDNVYNMFALPANDYYDHVVKTISENDSGFSDLAFDYVNNLSSNDDVDFESESFRSMPLEVQHEVIKNIAREKRYGYNAIPEQLSTKSGEEFSSIQIQRLLTRNSLQEKAESLRSTMNFRDSQNVVQSMKFNEGGSFSARSIQTKKILSRDQGHLMMIDPSENDLVDRLTKLKKDTLFNKIKANQDLCKTNDSCKLIVNDKILEEKEIFGKPNEEESNRSKTNDWEPFEKKKISNVYKETDIISDESKNTSNENVFNTALVDKISDSSWEFAENKHDSSYVTIKDDQDEKQEQSNIIFHTNLENSNLISDSLNQELVPDRSPQVKINVILNPEPHMTAEKIAVSDDKAVKSMVETHETLVNKNESVNYIEDSVSDMDRSDEINKQAESDESGDDFVDVPEMEYEEESSFDSQDLSQEEIEMIISDPDQWQHNIEEKIQNLYQEEQKIESQSASMSQRYYDEAKELLKLFGIPYLESPGEAEAQCAFLEKMNLIDGTITEDSDIWLFGGRMVYKHVFSRDFSVRAYNNKIIYNKLGLTQDLMICIALLSGSDYTTGIYGIGPVIAMEILADFSDPDLDQSHFDVLHGFKKWHTEWANSKIPFSGNPDRKRYLRFKINSQFPDRRVIEAYQRPIVDESMEPFIWAKPSIDKLLQFAKFKIGWEHVKVLDMLKMVLDENKPKSSQMTQKTILDYFTESTVDELINSKKLPSKRLKLATKHRNTVVKSVHKHSK